jgi:hypothetical protein
MLNIISSAWIIALRSPAEATLDPKKAGTKSEGTDSRASIIPKSNTDNTEDFKRNTDNIPQNARKICGPTGISEATSICVNFCSPIAFNMRTKIEM